MLVLVPLNTCLFRELEYIYFVPIFYVWFLKHRLSIFYKTHIRKENTSSDVFSKFDLWDWFCVNFSYAFIIIDWRVKTKYFRLSIGDKFVGVRKWRVVVVAILPTPTFVIPWWYRISIYFLSRWRCNITKMYLNTKLKIKLKHIDW